MKPALVTALLCVAATSAFGQSWKTMDVSRQVRDSGEHLVRVQYPVGRLTVRSTKEPVLYSMQLRYDEDRMRPLHSFDSLSRRLTVGFDADRLRGRNARDNWEETELTLSLSESVPLDVAMEIGAAEARLDMGGLAITRLRVETGAAEARLDFSEPNKTRMRRLDVQLGAADFVIRNLGNANVASIRVDGGVGKVNLDFGGDIKDDVTVDANVALGKLALRLPREVGVRVDVKRVIAAFDHHGLTRRGDSYYSDNWDEAKVRMRVRAETVFGAVEIDRTR